MHVPSMPGTNPAGTRSCHVAVGFLRATHRVEDRKDDNDPDAVSGEPFAHDGSPAGIGSHKIALMKSSVILPTVPSLPQL